MKIPIRFIVHVFRSLQMAEISQGVLDAISKAKDSKEAAKTADTDAANTAQAVVDAQALATAATQKSLDAHKTALSDAHAAIAALEVELDVEETPAP
jgi:hypothetical protein